jgi:hypothetical protein
VAQNHYPLIGRKPAPSCDAGPLDTANPFTPPTCPKCIARLEAKVAAEVASAAETKNAQERQLHAGTAAMFTDILNGQHRLAA